ncbi:MAG: hypothetical protein V1728_00990 [Candidatus Micrarchaeota archaeon]
MSMAVFQKFFGKKQKDPFHNPVQIKKTLIEKLSPLMEKAYPYNGVSISRKITSEYENCFELGFANSKSGSNFGNILSVQIESAKTESSLIVTYAGLHIPTTYTVKNEKQLADALNKIIDKIEKIAAPVYTDTKRKLTPA